MYKWITITSHFEYLHQPTYLLACTSRLSNPCHSVTRQHYEAQVRPQKLLAGSGLCATVHMLDPSLTLYMNSQIT